MTYLSIFEKFKILFDMLLDFEFILVFVVLLMLSTILYIIKKINTKKYIMMLLISFIVVFGISIISNYDVLSDTFDNFATIFFGNIYFPSIYVYISVLVIDFIAFIVSMLNVMVKKIYKIINSIVFILNNVLFVIILNIIAKNKIDIFSIDSLYTNTNLVVLLELSMGLFIVWILSLIVTYITNVICDRIANKKVVRNEFKEEVFNPVLEVNNELVCDTINNDYDVFTEVEVISKNVDDLVIENIDSTAKEEVVIDMVDTTDVDDVIIDEKITFNDILNGCVPVTYYDNKANEEEFDLVNPETYYKDKYENMEKENISFNDVNMLLNSDVNETSNNLSENIISDINLPVLDEFVLTKEKTIEDNLITNTVSLNDLIDDEQKNISEVELMDNNINVLEDSVNKVENNIYTIDDYKKFIKMLTDVKKYSNDTDINISDAVAISLITNYSVDDCLMFKNILENSLN